MKCTRYGDGLGPGGPDGPYVCDGEDGSRKWVGPNGTSKDPCVWGDVSIIDGVLLRRTYDNECL